MFRTLDARHDRFALSRPFRISRGVKTAADVVTVEIGEGDVIGRGEGVPYARYGETVEGALAAIDKARGAIGEGAGRADLLAILPPGAARNALDCALWDLEAKLEGHSVADCLGAREPGDLPTALTVGLAAPDVMAAEARAMADAPLLKVKVDATNPSAAIRAVRAAAPQVALIVDPNESWDEHIVRRTMPVLVECGVAVLEQPCPAGADGWLRDYDRPVPICADESIHVLGDLDTVAARYDAINIKLDKTGGLTAALELVEAGRGRDLLLMSGCMICSSLSIAPALQIARDAQWVDLDGPLWLADDRPGGIRASGGMLRPPDKGFWG